GGEQNLSVISARPREGSSWTGCAHVTLSRQLQIYTGQSTSPLCARNTQSFVAGHSVAYAFETEVQRASARPTGNRTGEDCAALFRYRTVAMNYIQLSTRERSGEGASNRYRNVERDNQVFTDLPRRTGVIKTGGKLSACGLRRASFSPRQR